MTNNFIFLGLFFSFFSMVFAESKPKKLVIIGDSLTAGYGVKKAEAYPQLLEDELNQQNKVIKVINAGISGSTSASCLSRLKWQLKGQPDFIMIALGGNDGLRGIDLSVTEANLAKCIKLAKENNIRVLFAGMKLPYNYGKKYRSDFEKLFNKLGRGPKITYIPFLLKDVGGKKELNLPDGIHPNPKGYKIIAKTVAEKMKEILNVKSKSPL